MKRLDAEVLQIALLTYRDLLCAHRRDIDAINVYPVPDSDTGTNAFQTVAAVVEEVAGRRDIDGLCEAMTHASLMGARGNSGVILSQIFKGIASALRGRETLGADELARGLRAAVAASYEAVGEPVEGTILTVLSAAADAAAEASTGEDDVVAVLQTARHASYEALARTPDLLEPLARAGVVDAGGRVLVLLFDALLHVLAGDPLPEPRATGLAGKPRAESARAGESAPATGARYELVFLLDAGDIDANALRTTLAAIGESVGVADVRGTWKCHVHADTVDQALAVARELGRVRDVHVTDLREQIASTRRSFAPRTSVVAVSAAGSMGELFARLGAEVIRRAEVSEQSLLRRIEETQAHGVVVLPDGRSSEEAALAAASLISVDVRVLVARSLVSSLAALLVFDPQEQLEHNIARMRAAIESVRTGCVVRDGEGWTATVEDRPVAHARTVAGAAQLVVDRLVTPSSEVVTVLKGQGATHEDDDALKDHVQRSHPHVSLELHDAGQQESAYEIGVE